MKVSEVFDLADAATAAAEDLQTWFHATHCGSDTSNADIWDHDEFDEIWGEWKSEQDTDNWIVPPATLKKAVAAIWHYYK